MPRPFFQFLAWLSLLLLAGVIAIWVRSYSAADLWEAYEVSGRHHSSIMRFHNLEIARGKLGFSRNVVVSRESSADDFYIGLEPEIKHLKSLPDDPHELVDHANRLGFYYERYVDSGWTKAAASSGIDFVTGGLSGTISWNHGTTGWTTTICIPLWLPAILLAPIPFLYAIGMWRRRRAKRRGLCLTCGYDLRESRDRCPECAAPVAPPRPGLARRMAPRFAAIMAIAIGALARDWGIQQVQRRQTEAWSQANAPRHLIRAIKAGDAKAFLSALECGADPNTDARADMRGASLFVGTGPQQDFPSALNVVVEAHRAAMVRELLRRGADPGAKNSAHTPLLSAAGAGDLEIVRLLLAGGANPNGAPFVGFEPLVPACAGGHVEIVRMLLDAGANANVCDSSSRTALYLGVTAQTHRREITSFMLAHHADPNFRLLVAAPPQTPFPQDPEPLFIYNALHAAIGWGDVEIVRELLSAGADVNGIDDEGHTPLHALAQMPDHRAEILSLLMAHHPKFNVLDAAGNSPLHLAARNRDAQLVELLVKAGADVTFQDSRGHGVLDIFDDAAFPDVAALLRLRETQAASQPSRLSK